MATDAPTPRDKSPEPIRDHRPRPTGGLPPAIQTWVMLGLAAIIVVIVLATQGTPSRSSRPAATTPAAQAPSQSVAADFRSRLDADARQLEEARRQLADQQALAADAPLDAESPSASPPATDPYAAVRQEQIRRDYDSLFTDAVAYGAASSSRRARTPAGAEEIPSLDAAFLAALSAATQRSAAASMPAASTPSSVPATPPTARDAPARLTPPLTAAGGWHRLLEGTIIEATLTTRLDGEFSGSAQALVTTPVYAPDTRVVLIPAGARLLGQARAVTVNDQQRLGLGFHRLVWPDGRTVTLEGTPPALNQIGETGLRDVVNHHYASVFGSAIAVAAITGLANIGFGLGSGDTVVVRSGAGLDQAASRLLDRYLNRRPSITIREGHRLRVLLTSDLDLPVYEAGEWPVSPAPQASLPSSQPDLPTTGGRP